MNSIESEFSISTPEAMMELGAEFATHSKPGDIFALVGTLGTGKTHWTKGFLKKLNPQSNVTSPTFSLVNEYSNADIQVNHFDFYRLKSADELIELGWDEYLDDQTITICEWADLFPQLFPENTHWLKFAHQSDGSRKVERIDKV